MPKKKITPPGKPPPEKKLGKKAPLADPRNFLFSNYTVVTEPAPEPPAEASWIMKVPPPWNVFLNDQLGCCVISAMGHMVQQMTYFAGKPFIPSNADILAAYEHVGGYVPGDPATDNGCFMLDALKYWRHIGLAGHKILAFVQLDPLNSHEMRQAIQLFGGYFGGFALPISVRNSDRWTVPDSGPYLSGSPGTWGGHAVSVLGSSPITDSCITWGERLKMSHNFRKDYCDEAYAVVSTDFIDQNGLSPSGFNLKQLLSDLSKLT